MSDFYIVDAKTSENRGSVVMDDYDPYTGKYAFCEPTEEDKELEEAAQGAHDNFVRSLVEADGERRELRRLLTLAKDDLLYLLLQLKTKEDNPDKLMNEKGFAALYYLQSECGMSIDKVNTDFGEICDYLEKKI